MNLGRVINIQKRLKFYIFWLSSYTIDLHNTIFVRDLHVQFHELKRLNFYFKKTTQSVQPIRSSNQLTLKLLITLFEQVN